MGLLPPDVAVDSAVLPSSSTQAAKTQASGRTHRQWLLLLGIILMACFVIFIVLKQIKPVSLRNQTSLAAPAVNLSWSLLEPEDTVSSQIYRNTSGFLTDPDPAQLIATIPSPTATFADTAVTTGTTYYYSIFEVDDTGAVFDPSYMRMQAADIGGSSGGGSGSGGPSGGSSGGSTGDGSSGGTSGGTSSASGSGSGSIMIPPSNVTLADPSNFICPGDATVYAYYHGHKEAYSEAAVFLAWNSSWNSIVTISAEQCAEISGSGIVRLPEGSLVKVAGAATVWHIEGTEARPVASLTALYGISSQPKIIIISLNYLHTYSGGAVIQ